MLLNVGLLRSNTFIKCVAKGAFVLGENDSGNHFPPNPHVWLSRKMIFSGKWLPVDQYFHLWPGNDFSPSFSLQIISGKRERERERRESPNRAARRSTIAIDEIARCDHRSSGTIDERARRTRTARRTIAPTSPPLDVAFTTRSHLLLHRAISM